MRQIFLFFNLKTAVKLDCAVFSLEPSGSAVAVTNPVREVTKSVREVTAEYEKDVCLLSLRSQTKKLQQHNTNQLQQGLL